MGTTNYNLPTITAEDTINGVNAINGLANAVDSALKTIDDKASGGEAYVLPAATTATLGGVIVGSGLTVDSSGKLDATAQPYVLPAATTSALGGVKVGTGLSVDGAGMVSVNTTWLASQISSAIASALTKGTTWGDLDSHGFVYLNA